MNELQVFNFQDYDVRVVEVSGEPWFVAKDLCETLGLDNVSAAISRLDEDEKLTLKLLMSGQKRDSLVVNESGVYSLILTSTKPEAKKVKKWVTSEVLPTIRKTGSYGVKQIQPPTTFLEALKLAVEQEERIQLLAPKAEKYDRFLATDGLFSMEEIAKSFEIGRNTLLKTLREHKIFTQNNLPMQQFMPPRKDYFQVVYEDKNGYMISSTQVNPKGFEFLSQKLDEWGYR